MTYLGVLFSSIFLTNIMFYYLDGMVAVDRNTQEKTLVKNGISQIVIGIIVTLIVYPINKYLLTDIGWTYLAPLLLVLVAIGVSLLVNVVLEKIKEGSGLGKVNYQFLFLQSVVISAALIVIGNQSFMGSLFQMLGFTVGHFLISFLIFTMRPRLDLPGIPKAFKGVPIVLITVGLIAMIFVGLAGIL